MSDLIQIDPRAYKPYPTNYNTHPPAQIDELARSLAEFGQPKNVVCWRGHILAGHGLIEAAIKSNLPTIEARDVSDWPQEKAEAFLIADNETARMGVPDYGRLKALVEMARAQGQQVPGVTAERLAEIVAEAKRGEGNGNGQEPETPTEVEAEKYHKKWGVNLGDVWQLGQHTIACLDSLDEANIKRIVVDSPDVLWADAPYGMDLDTDYTAMNGSRNNVEFKQRKKVVGGKNYPQVTGDSEPFNPLPLMTYFVGVSEQFWWGADYYAERIQDKNDGSWLVWDKRDGNEQFDKMFGSSFELCWSKTAHRREVIRVRWCGVFGTEQEPDKRRFHPTQKPVKLFEWFGERYFNDNWLILDPFLGSGQSVLGAEKLGRRLRVIGFELEPIYISVVLQRWQQMTGQTPVKVAL